MKLWYGCGSLWRNKDDLRIPEPDESSFLKMLHGIFYCWIFRHPLLQRKVGDSHHQWQARKNTTTCWWVWLHHWTWRCLTQVRGRAPDRNIRPQARWLLHPTLAVRSKTLYKANRTRGSWLSQSTACIRMRSRSLIQAKLKFSDNFFEPKMLQTVPHTGFWESCFHSEFFSGVIVLRHMWDSTKFHQAYAALPEMIVGSI